MTGGDGEADHLVLQGRPDEPDPPTEHKGVPSLSWLPEDVHTQGHTVSSISRWRPCWSMTVRWGPAATLSLGQSLVGVSGGVEREAL